MRRGTAGAVLALSSVLLLAGCGVRLSASPAPSPASPAALAPVELMVAILRCGGLSLEQAMAGMHVLTAAVRGYAALIANEMADPGHRDTEALVALASPEQFPHLSEAAARPRQDPQAAFEFGLRAIAFGLFGTPDAQQRAESPAVP